MKLSTEGEAQRKHRQAPAPEIAFTVAATITAVVLVHHWVTMEPATRANVLSAIREARVLAAGTQAAHEGEQTNHDFFSNGGFPGNDANPRQTANRQRDQNQRAAGNELPECASLFNGLHALCMACQGRFTEWKDAAYKRIQFRDGGDYFRVVSGGGFGFVVRNTVRGRAVGRVRIVHARLSRLWSQRGDRTGVPA